MQNNVILFWQKNILPLSSSQKPTTKMRIITFPKHKKKAKHPTTSHAGLTDLQPPLSVYSTTSTWLVINSKVKTVICFPKHEYQNTELLKLFSAYLLNVNRIVNRCPIQLTQRYKDTGTSQHATELQPDCQLACLLVHTCTWLGKFMAYA